MREYVRLNRPDVAHERAPQVCYINFLSDFFAAEKNAVRTDGLRAWAEVKRLDGPKTYQAWKQDAEGSSVCGNGDNPNPAF